MLDEAAILNHKPTPIFTPRGHFMLKFKGNGLKYNSRSYHIVTTWWNVCPNLTGDNNYVSQSKKAAVEEASKQSEQNKVCVTRKHHKS